MHNSIVHNQRGNNANSNPNKPRTEREENDYLQCDAITMCILLYNTFMYQYCSLYMYNSVCKVKVKCVISYWSVGGVLIAVPKAVSP